MKSLKNFYEKLYTKETTTKAAATKFLSKIPNRKKISSEQFNYCESKISLDEIVKSINSQTNNKSSGYGALKNEFYKHFSTKLAPVLLDVLRHFCPFCPIPALFITVHISVTITI